MLAFEASCRLRKGVRRKASTLQALPLFPVYPQVCPLFATKSSFYRHHLLHRMRVHMSVCAKAIATRIACKGGAHRGQEGQALEQTSHALRAPSLPLWRLFSPLTSSHSQKKAVFGNQHTCATKYPLFSAAHAAERPQQGTNPQRFAQGCASTVSLPPSCPPFSLHQRCENWQPRQITCWLQENHKFTSPAQKIPVMCAAKEADTRKKRAGLAPACSSAPCTPPILPQRRTPVIKIGT